MTGAKRQAIRHQEKTEKLEKRRRTGGHGRGWAERDTGCGGAGDGCEKA